MPRRKVKPQRRETEYLSIGGLLIEAPAKPWCDCRKPEWQGLTRRDDGVWVRSCCMRRTPAMYEKFGDNPVPPTERKP